MREQDKRRAEGKKGRKANVKGSLERRKCGVDGKGGE